MSLVTRRKGAPGCGAASRGLVRASPPVAGWPRKTMAGNRLTIADMDARAEALEECADHLDGHWTDDAREREAGNWVATRLRVEAHRWRLRAAAAIDLSFLKGEW